MVADVSKAMAPADDSREEQHHQQQEEEKQAMEEKRGPPARPHPSEEFEHISGLRITRRKIAADKWERHMQANNRSFVPLSRVSLEFARNHIVKAHDDRERIIVGTVCEKQPAARLPNGAMHVSLLITDLAKPEPRIFTVQLIGDAYMTWRHKTLRRGCIMAFTNPVLVDANPKAGEPKVLRVEKGTSLLELGHCPSLGWCDMKDCRHPCDSDAGQRFCAVHLSLVHAMKTGRTNMVAAQPVTSASSAKGSRPRVDRAYQAPPLSVVEERRAMAESSTSDACARRTSVALQFENRRRATADANDDYVRAIRTGSRPDEMSTSLVAVLGRSMEGNAEVELDLAMIPLDDKGKVERVLGSRALKRQNSEASQEEENEEEQALLSMQKRLKADKTQPELKETEVLESSPPSEMLSMKQVIAALTQKRCARSKRAEALQRKEVHGVKNKGHTGAEGGDAPSAQGIASVAKTSSGERAAQERDKDMLPESMPSDVQGRALRDFGSQQPREGSSRSNMEELPVEPAEKPEPSAVSPEELQQAKELIKEVEAIGEEVALLEAVLRRAEAVTAKACRESGLYDTIGAIAMRSPSMEARSVAKQARRRLRIVWDSAEVSKEANKAGA